MGPGLDTVRAAVVPLIFVLFVRSGTTEEEIGSPLRVAQCRARCLQRFSNGGGISVQQSCILGPRGTNCHMCWENCQLLQSNFAVWGAICDEVICFPGCKEACQFQKEAGGEQQRAPVIQTRGEEVIRTTEQGVVSWPEPVSVGGPLVYVLMKRLPEGPWRQVVQSVERSARLGGGGPRARTPPLRVLVVNRDGLVTIYSPMGPRSPDLATARAVLSTLGKDPLARLGYPIPDLPPPPPPQIQGKRINTEIVPTTHRSLAGLDDPGKDNVSGDGLLLSGGSGGTMEVAGVGGGVSNRIDGASSDDSWNLREVSLIHQKVLVIAEIAWEPRGGGNDRSLLREVYFVTWEVDGGGLKGNLFTDSTCVTLSLWPDTIYHIQVELVRHDSTTERSEELVVDTQRAVAVEVVTEDSGSGPATAPLAPLRAELALGASAALALFLVLLMALLIVHSARRRAGLHDKLMPPDETPPPPGFRNISLCRVVMGGASSEAGPDRSRQPSSTSAPLSVCSPKDQPPNRTRTLHV